MSEVLDTIEQDAMQLTGEQRLTLAHRLMGSVETSEDNSVDELWDSEIRARIEKYDKGLSKSVPVNEVFSELDQRLGR
jgi:putative addiction module component (TIGR02574 family)